MCVYQCDIFHDNFKYVNSNIRNVLFHKYCTPFYESPILPFNKCLTEEYTSWGVVMHRLWKVSRDRLGITYDQNNFPNKSKSQ